MHARKTLAAATTVITTLVLMAGPAMAHSQLDPSSVTVGKPAFITVTTANEESAAVDKVVLTAPTGISIGEATKSPAGWTATHTETSVTWTGGKLAPETFDVFGFEIEAPGQPGTYNFTVTTSVGTDAHPSTVPVTVVAAGATTTTTAAATATTQPSSATTVATAPNPTVDTEALSDSLDSTKNKTNVALVLAAASLGVGLVAILMAASRRRTSGTAPGSAPSGAPQDF